MIASFPNHNCIVNARPKIIKEAPYISIFQANVQIPKGNYKKGVSFNVWKKKDLVEL